MQLLPHRQRLLSGRRRLYHHFVPGKGCGRCVRGEKFRARCNQEDGKMNYLKKIKSAEIPNEPKILRVSYLFISYVHVENASTFTTSAAFLQWVLK